MSDLSGLSSAERAAVIVMLLSNEEAASILADLEPHELQLVGEKMCALGEIGPERIMNSIGGFIENAQCQAIEKGDRTQMVRGYMTSALGEVKAENLMTRIAPDAPSRSLDLARWLSEEILLSLVLDEHPQAVAVLLLLLEAEPAAQILSGLPEELQPQVVERIARIGPVSPEAIAMLDEMLSAKIANRFGAAALKMGGAREAAELINNAVASVGKRVIPVITARDAQLAGSIEAEMFTFDMLLDLDNLAMGRLLRDVESEVLVDALKGLEEPKRDCIFAAMSSRAADGVRDEIEMRGKLKREDVNAAQKAMVEKARELADAGEISFGSGEDDFL